MRAPLLVGVDTHRKANQVHCLDAMGQTLATFTARNNRPGTQGVIDRLVDLLRRGDFDGVRIAAEATSWYWLPFFHMLSSDPTLHAWPVELYAFNPRVTAKYRETFVDLDKDDPADAYVLTDRLRLGRELPHPFTFDAETLALRILTRFRLRLTQQLVMAKLYALTLVYLKASDYTLSGSAAFEQTFSATSVAVLTEFASLDELVAMPLDDLAQWLDQKGRHSFANPAGTARKLQALAHTSYRLPEPVLETVHLALTLSLHHVQYLERLRKQLDRAIAEQLERRPNPLTTIPGIGPVFAAGILAEIGDLRRFGGDEAKVAKFAGFKWRKRKSADHRSEETPLTRRGNHYLRYYLCEAANLVRMHDAEYAAYYEKKYHEVPKHQHKRAVTLTARKLVRLIVRLLTTNQAYRPRRTDIRQAYAGTNPAHTTKPSARRTS